MRVSSLPYQLSPVRGDDPVSKCRRDHALMPFIGAKDMTTTAKSPEVSKSVVRQFAGTNVVDVMMRRLRAKVDDPFDKKMIQTIRGVGYVLNAD